MLRALQAVLIMVDYLIYERLRRKCSGQRIQDAVQRCVRCAFCSGGVLPVVYVRRQRSPLLVECVVGASRHVPAFLFLARRPVACLQRQSARAEMLYRVVVRWRERARAQQA